MMTITVNRDPKKRLYLDVNFPNALALADVVVQRGYKLDNILHPTPTRVLFVLSPSNGPSGANFIIQFLKQNYAVGKLTWKTR